MRQPKLQIPFVVWPLLLAGIGFVVTTVNGATTANEDYTCPACAFDGLDGPDCRLYGELLPESGLIAWHLASPACLKAYNGDDDGATEYSFNHDIIKQIWEPHGWIEEPPTVTGIQHLLHWFQSTQDIPTDNIAAAPSNEEGETELEGAAAAPRPTTTTTTTLSRSEVKTIRRLQLDFLSHFFQEESFGMGVNDRVVFKPQVQLGDETMVDCQMNSNNCWTALRQYLTESEIGSGVEQVAEIGQVLMQWKREDLEREQRDLRMKLCLNGRTGVVNNVCQPLLDQILEQFNDHPDLNCVAYSNGLYGGAGLHTNLPPHNPNQKSEDESVNEESLNTCHLDAGGGQYGTLNRDLEELKQRSTGHRPTIGSAFLGVASLLLLLLQWQ